MHLFYHLYIKWLVNKPKKYSALGNDSRGAYQEAVYPCIRVRRDICLQQKALNYLQVLHRLFDGPL